jgi:hypothetical protein
VNSIYFLLVDVCDPPCVNGACVSDNNCSCSEGFRGDLCEHMGMLVADVIILWQIIACYVYYSFHRV